MNPASRLPVTIDIETLPLASSLGAEYPEADRPAPGNYKDRVKIAEWRVRDEQKWRDERVKECSLSPRLGRVLCLGFSLPCSDGPVESAFMATTEAEEKILLERFWDMMRDHEGRVVTFNGTFDLTFIVIRSLVHNVQPSVPSDVIRSWFARYRVQPHFDCRAVLTNWDPFGSGTLSEWCSTFGIEHTNGVKGSEIAELFAAGKLREIADHCQADVTGTRKLYERVVAMYGAAAA